MNSEMIQLAERLTATVNAEKPTKAQMVELRRAMIDAPELVAGLGDMSQQIKHTLIDDMAAGRPGLRALLSEQTEQMARELGGETCSPLERRLIDNIVIAHLHWQTAEFKYQRKSARDTTLAEAAYLERRLSATQRRYLRAIESLARVRRLLARVPGQVNIAQQQVVVNNGANAING